jgi:hypothetical protein
VTESQIGQIEAALAVVLPPHYRRFLLDFPAGLYHPEAKEGDQWRWLQADSLMFHTVTSFVKYNQSVRAPGSEPWPSKYLIIGTNGGGDYWCIDLSDPGGSDQLVYEYDHERGQFRIVGWLQKHAAKLQEPEEWE